MEEQAYTLVSAPGTPTPRPLVSIIDFVADGDEKVPSGLDWRKVLGELGNTTSQSRGAYRIHHSTELATSTVF